MNRMTDKKPSYRSSVSAIILAGQKVFMQKRNKSMRDFPGYWSFPGGKKEEGETAKETLKREISEELSFSLESDLVENIKELVTLPSPDFVPFSFKNTFFLIQLSEEVSFKLEEESEEGKWFTPKEIIHLFQNGEFLTIPPVLQLVRHLNKTKGLEGFSFSPLDQMDLPWSELLGGIFQLMPLSHTLPPFNRTNCFYFKEECLLIDPSPSSDEEKEKLIATVDTLGEVESILITHHHPDHIERANELARHWDAFILIHRHTYELIQEKHPDYFDDTFVFFISEGEEVGSYAGGKILAYNLKGHAKAQLCLADSKKRWFLAGDLFQGVGSVVLSTEKRSLNNYLESLQFVIDYNPEIIIPSHGSALGGTELLKRLIRHREKREQQIINLLKEGFGVEDITSKLYGQFSKQLQHLGKRNVQAHIEKIKEEGK